MTTTNRPLGITIIAFLTGLFAILSLCGHLVGLVGAPFQIFGNAGIGGTFVQAFGAIFGLVLAGISLVIAWGLWNLQPWAFWATVITMVLQLLSGGIWARGWICGVNIIPIVILLYLFLDKDVRAAFRV